MRTQSGHCTSHLFSSHHPDSSYSSQPAFTLLPSSCLQVGDTTFPPPSAKVLLASLHVTAFYYHSGFIAFNLFLLLSLWLFPSQQVKDCSEAWQLSCTADKKSKKYTLLLCYFTDSTPLSKRKNQKNSN